MAYPNPAPLPITTAPTYLQPDGTYTIDSTGAPGEQLVQLPVTDLVCVEDLDPAATETTTDLQALAQDVYHLLIEVQGSNVDDLTRGIGIKNLLSASTIKLAAAATIIDSQLRKDDRITSSKTTITLNPDGSYALTVTLVASGSVIPLSYSYSAQRGLVVNPA